MSWGNVVKIELSDIRSTYEGFNRLNQVAAQAKNCFYEEIDIDMSRASWFDANMCAPFGAILYKISRGLNTVRLSKASSKVETILSKNGFLQNYGRPTKVDTYRTTIEYMRLEPDDDRYFGSYIDSRLMSKRLPHMSRGLRKKFMESIFEVFSNAVIHSQTELGIFSCGQLFPRKCRLDFSIADLGIGICRNVNEKTNLDFTPEEAVIWAMEGRNTTKTGSIPSGLGLKLLQEFVTKNKGRMQIVSDLAYWELSEGNTTTKSFSNPFPGTVVNIEINTADKKSYRLVSELRPEDVF